MPGQRKTRSNPRRGIKIRGVDNFIESCGGRDVLRTETVAGVCQHITAITGRCTDDNLSYCDKLVAEKSTDVGIANVYVACAPDTNFLSAFDAIKRCLGTKVGIVLWLEAFSCDPNNDVPTQQWWRKEMIKRIGHTVLVISALEHQLGMSMESFLEVYTTSATYSAFDVAFVESAHIAYHDMMVEDVHALHNLFGSLSLSKIPDSGPKDKAYSKYAEVLGVHSVNTAVIHCFMEWLISDVKRFIVEANREFGNRDCIKRYIDDYTNIHAPILNTLQRSASVADRRHHFLQYSTALGTIYLLEGRHLSAEWEFQSVADKLWDFSSEEAIYARKELAKLSTSRGRHSKAESLLRGNLESLRQRRGDINNAKRSDEILENMKCLAVALSKQADSLKEAEELFQHCVNEYDMQIQSGVSVETMLLDTLVEMATFYSSVGRYQDAERLFAESLGRAKRMHEANDDCHTIAMVLCIIRRYSECLEVQGKFKKSFKLRTESLQLAVANYGEFDRRYIEALRNISAVHYMLSEYNASIQTRVMTTKKSWATTWRGQGSWVHSCINTISVPVAYACTPCHYCYVKGLVERMFPLCKTVNWEVAISCLSTFISAPCLPCACYADQYGPTCSRIIRCNQDCRPICCQSICCSDSYYLTNHFEFICAGILSLICCSPCIGVYTYLDHGFRHCDWEWRESQEYRLMRICVLDVVCCPCMRVLQCLGYHDERLHMQERQQWRRFKRQLSNATSYDSLTMSPLSPI
jgi:tetratricopeptide (TPR) repeat protein